jgi:signal transduction histidine kinase
MVLKDLPIRKKLIRVILLISSAVLLLTCSIYFIYDFITYRQLMVRQMSILGGIISSNSTAALAFEDAGEAKEILSAVRADPHIVSAILLDKDGKLFCRYPDTDADTLVPVTAQSRSYYFKESHLEGFEPVMQGKRLLGTLYLKSDMGAMYDRFVVYSVLVIFMIGLALLLAYFLSKYLQQQITTPILRLAEVAKAVSNRQDYSVRATKLGEDETGVLTDAFNHMLDRMEKQTLEITGFNQTLEQNVIDRTHELQVANKELEAFSYSVSHDLRAPLRSIHGYMNIFSEEYFTQLDDEGKRLINIILSNGRRMGQLIDDLLAFSQLGRKELRKAEISMEEMVAAICAEQKEMEKDRAINFKLSALPPAHADRVTIKQVWTNLLSNAVKYSKNKPEATIEVGSYGENGNVVYYVKDNGAGFDMLYYV